jgi:hypothetical protein
MRWILPESVDGISIENQQFDASPLQSVGKDGKIITIHGVDVPDHLDKHMKSRNYMKAAKPDDPDARVVEPAPVRPEPDSSGLRTDGPTLAQWLKAGYIADAYPPPGYAVRPDPVADAEQKKLDVDRAAADLAVIKNKADELAAMNFDQLGTWLVEHGIKPKPLNTKEARLAAAYTFINYTPEAANPAPQGA